MEKSRNTELGTALIGIITEIVKEVLAENGAKVAQVAEPLKPATGKVGKGAVGSKPKAENPPEADASTGDREEELKAMKYNDLKALVSKLGGKAVGKAPDLIKQILELEANGAGEDPKEEPKTEKAGKGAKAGKNVEKEPEVEPEDEGEDDTQEFIDFLSDLEKEDLLEIGKKLEVAKPKAFKKEAYIDLLVADTDALQEALDELGYYDGDNDGEGEPDDAEGEGEVSLADKLDEKDTKELASMCADYELSVKGKKQALIDRLVKAVEAGDIDEAELLGEEDADPSDDSDNADGEEAWYSKEELEEMEEADLKDIAKEYDIEVPTKVVKKKKVTDVGALIEAILALGEAEDGEEGSEDFDASEERISAETDVEKDIRAKYKAKKLKDTAIAKFLEPYNDGEAGDASKEDMLEKYIEIHKAMVDDDGEVHESEDCYIRNDKYFCCGVELGELEGEPYCEVCGTTYSD